MGDEGEHHHAAFWPRPLLPRYLPSRVLRIRFDMTQIVAACVCAAFPRRWGVLGLR